MSETNEMIVAEEVTTKDATEEKEKMTATEFGKQVVTAIGTVGAKKIIDNAVDCYIPEDVGLFGKVCYGVGKYAIAGMITQKSVNWLGDTYDNLTTAMAKLITAIEDKKEEKEA